MTRTEFIQWAERYKDMVFRIALNYYGNPQDGEDTVQEVLLRLYGCKKEFQSEEHVRAWLIRVTINQCKNGLRQKKRRSYVPLEDADRPVQFQFPEQSELYRQLMALPEGYRTALYLFYYEDLSVSEIAHVLHLSTTAVTTRLSRARQQLKTNLTEVWKDED